MLNVVTIVTGMENDAVLPVADTGKRSSSPPNIPTKRLKQACLQFKSFRTNTAKICSSQQTLKKRCEKDVTSPQCVTTKPSSEPLTILDYCKENCSPAQNCKPSGGGGAAAHIKPCKVVLTNIAAATTTTIPLIDICEDISRVSKNSDGESSRSTVLNVLNAEKCADESKNDSDELLGDVTEPKLERVTADPPALVDLSAETGDVKTEIKPAACTESKNIKKKRRIRHSLEDQLKCEKLTLKKLKLQLLEIKCDGQGELKSEMEDEKTHNCDRSESDNDLPKSITGTATSPLSPDENRDVLNSSSDANTSLPHADSSDINQLSTPLTTNKKRGKVKNLQPAELLEKQKHEQEKLKVQLEIVQLKAELRKQREEAKKERERQKAEAVERKRKELQEKRDKEEKEKLERLLKKEEKRKQQELQRQTADEKANREKEKQDERKKVEEEQRKKNKVKAVFASFFVKKDVAPDRLQQVENEVSCLFLPFKAKDNMRLAPLYRTPDSNSSTLTRNLDVHLQGQELSVLYLDELKKKLIVPCKTKSTWPSNDKEVEVVHFCDSSQSTKSSFRAKLLQFSEDIRPPFWGTWRKKSDIVTPKRPFCKDEKFFDYEVDSEAEWEEEEPGESLSHTENEKESEDEYEVDNEFFVPHGYLSDEEKQDDEATALSPEALKAQLKRKELEFENELKKSCAQFKPCILGCIWMEDPENLKEVENVLQEFSAVIIDASPIDTCYSRTEVQNDCIGSVAQDGTLDTPSTDAPSSSSATTRHQKILSDKAMPWFIQLVHGNTNSTKIIIAEFLEFYRSAGHLKEECPALESTATATEVLQDPRGTLMDETPTKSSEKRPRVISMNLVKRTLRKIASYGKFPELKSPKVMWCVHSSIREKYNLMELPIPNEWKYHIPMESINVRSPVVASTPKSVAKKFCPSKFFKREAGSMVFPDKSVDGMDCTEATTSTDDAGHHKPCDTDCPADNIVSMDI